VVVVLAVVALAAAVVQASTGLGFALILSPAVFALLEPESAVVAITVLGLALNGLVLFGERRRPRVAWGEVGPILIASLPGAVCGVLVLRALPKSVLQIAVGLAVIGAAALRARARRDATPADNQAQTLLTTLAHTSVVSLSRLIRGAPSLGGCVHHRRLTLRIRSSSRVRRLDLYVAGKRVRHVRGRALRRAVHLRYLPRRTYTLRAQSTLRDGRHMVGQRRVIACGARAR